jgi:hypothetical protein
MLVGLGLINYIRADGDNEFDLIPVDITCNQILIATAYGPEKPKQMMVYNSGTSKANPITMRGYKDRVLHCFKYIKFN